MSGNPRGRRIKMTMRWFLYDSACRQYPNLPRVATVGLRRTWYQLVEEGQRAR